MNQNDRVALAAAMLIKAYCTSIDMNDCCDDKGTCIFSDGYRCMLANNDPEFWKLDKAVKE